MRVVRRLSSVRDAAASIVVALTLLSVGQASQREAVPKPGIRNFGCVNERFYRGAQPSPGDYRALAALGIRTIIDLQREGEPDEPQLVEAAGMKFLRIPMSDRSSPSRKAAEEFLSVVNDPANQPVFVHCRGGRHLTGAMIAIYRLTNDRWTADQAFVEMKQYEFERGFGHGSLKDFVFDFYSTLDQRGIVVNSNK
jgi:protein tyrosine/serine phosphatase